MTLPDLLTPLASSIVVGHLATALLLSWSFFGRFRIARPPIVVLNLWDVGVLIALIVLVPLLYLVLPLWLVAALLGLGTFSSLYLAAEAVLPTRRATWLVCIFIVAADTCAAVA